MAMASQPHFVLFPLMSPGHMNPMIDIARMLAHQNVIVTVITTPHNAARFSATFARFSESKLQIRLIQVQFPHKEAGIPDGCENFDKLPSMGLGLSFFNTANTLQQPVENLFQELKPKPNCIISDVSLHYTSHIASKFNIPRISFYGVGCFCMLCLHNLVIHNVLEKINDESEYFVIPGIPDKIEMNKLQIPGSNHDENWEEFNGKMAAAEMATYGVIMNSFEELEAAYSRGYKKARNGKVWCVGPVSLSNKSDSEKAQRGNKASIDESQCLKWLDLQKPNSVIYVCLGSMCNLIPLQLIELALAIEASNRPFIWVIKKGKELEVLDKWIEEGFEERIKPRGLLIRGWAPQVLILSQPAIGGFITHCGWNSTLEAICAGMPMLTWPLFGDQFLNESFVVQILRTGVRVGVERPVNWGEEEKTGVLVKAEDVVKAIEELMDDSKESEERRKRARELAEMAKRAVEEGGSSHLNMTLLIQDIMQQSKKD